MGAGSEFNSVTRSGTADRIAVVVVDAQRDFCDPGGVVFQASETQVQIRNAIRQINTVLVAARSMDIPCFIVRSFFDDKYKLPSLLSKHRKLGIRQKVCCENTWGSEFTDIGIEFSDFVVTKHTADAFLYTSLEPLLWKLQVRWLMLCGFLTEICILETGRSAIQRGFSVVVPEDATAGLSEVCAEDALDELSARQGHRARLSNFERQLEQFRSKRSGLSSHTATKQLSFQLPRT